MTGSYRKTSWIHPHLEVRSSPTAGRGLFARVPIAAGEIVMEWGGLVGTRSQLAGTKTVPDSEIPISEDLVIVTPAHYTDLDDFFLNHSCDPNLWMVDEVTFAARRDILPGEEATADYAYWQAEEGLIASWTCRCGSPLCRRRVTGRDWRLPELQARYRGHFSPFINARIAALCLRQE